MTYRSSVKTFLGALVKDTGSLMSGLLSVVAAILALFYNASHARTGICTSGRF